MLVSINKIKVNPGRREVEAKDINDLAKSISEIGLLNPITVTPDHALIAGLHRYPPLTLRYGICGCSTTLRTVPGPVNSQGALVPLRLSLDGILYCRRQSWRLGCGAVGRCLGAAMNISRSNNGKVLIPLHSL